MSIVIPNINRKLILPIQYLRGVAALMVVWYHARGLLPGLAAHIPWDFGTTGVDLFFVISGFIMVVTTHGASISSWQFLRRRLIRIVPLYWLLTLLMVGIALILPNLFKTLQVTPVTLVQSLLFIPHFSHSFPTHVWPLLVPGWTLNFEMFFYVVFGISLSVPLRWRLTTLTVLLVVLIGVGYTLGPFRMAAAQMYTSPLLLEFAAGALVGAWWVKGGRLPLTISVSVFLLGVSMLFLMDRVRLGHLTQIIGAALIVIGALDTRLATWKNDALRIMGDSSYSIYLTHIFTLGALRIVWSTLMPASPNALVAVTFMLTSLLASAVIGCLTYRWIETPLQRYLSAYLQRAKYS